MTDIKGLFPITVTLTKEMIDISVPGAVFCCQGALLLRKALGEWANGRQIAWGILMGTVDGVLVTTAEAAYMPLIMKPGTFTLILVQPNQFIVPKSQPNEKSTDNTNHQ